jgi:hypothetical protein
MPTKTCPFVEEAVFENQSLGEGKSIMGICLEDPVMAGNRTRSSAVYGSCGDRGWFLNQGLDLRCVEGVRAREGRQQPAYGEE